MSSAAEEPSLTEAECLELIELFQFFNWTLVMFTAHVAGLDAQAATELIQGPAERLSHELGAEIEIQYGEVPAPPGLVAVGARIGPAELALEVAIAGAMAVFEGVDWPEATRAEVSGKEYLTVEWAAPAALEQGIVGLQIWACDGATLIKLAEQTLSDRPSD